MRELRMVRSATDVPPGTLEPVGRPQDIKALSASFERRRQAVEQGELLGQQVLWHAPQRRMLQSEEKGDGSTVSTACLDQPMRGWFDGHKLYWERMAGTSGDEDEAPEGELPLGPWVRITSALEPGGIPGPDCGLWTLQQAFYAECAVASRPFNGCTQGYGPLPLEYLQKLGQFQAGPGARELFLRTRRDAKQERSGF